MCSHSAHERAVTRRVYPSLRVHCPQCDLCPTTTNRLGSEAAALLSDFEPRDGDRILWADDGCARCPDCGHQLNAEIGGWVKPLRWQCLGCGDPLNGRQVKWCNRKFGRWSKACSIAWANPSLLASELLAQQQGLCGICCRPFTTEERMRVEVDHVVPVSKGGPRVIENLRTTHRVCNQAKKARSLIEARIDLGLTDTEVLRRLAGAEPRTVEMLRGPRLDVRNNFLGRLDEPVSQLRARERDGRSVKAVVDRLLSTARP